MPVHGAFLWCRQSTCSCGCFFSFDHWRSIKGGTYFLVGSLWWPRPGWDGYLYSFFSLGGKCSIRWFLAVTLWFPQFGGHLNLALEKGSLKSPSQRCHNRRIAMAWTNSMVYHIDIHGFSSPNFAPGSRKQSHLAAFCSLKTRCKMGLGVLIVLYTFACRSHIQFGWRCFCSTTTHIKWELERIEACRFGQIRHCFGRQNLVGADSFWKLLLLEYLHGNGELLRSPIPPRFAASSRCSSQQWKQNLVVLGS